MISEQNMSRFMTASERLSGASDSISGKPTSVSGASSVSDASSVSGTPGEKSDTPSAVSPRLKEIPGIGPVLEKKLISRFGSEEKAFRALKDGGADVLSEIDGITSKTARNLSAAVRHLGGESSAVFLKTKECEAVYDGILKTAREYCHTPYARHYVDGMIPYPASRMDKIERVREKMTIHTDLIRHLPNDVRVSIDHLLSGISPAEEPAPQRSADKAIIAFTEKTFERARARFGDFLRVHLVSDVQECRDLFASYRSVILFEFPEFELPEDNYVYFKDPENTSVSRLLPETDMAYFVKNKKSIHNALSLSALLTDEKLLLSLPDRIFSFGKNYEPSSDSSSGSSSDSSSDSFSKEDIQNVLRLLDSLDGDGRPIVGGNPEYDRLKNISENIDEAVLRRSAEADRKLASALSQTQLTLDGAQMMQIFSGGADLKQIIGGQVSKSYETIVKETVCDIVSEFSLKSEEAASLRFLFGEEISCPLKIDQDRLKAFKREIDSEIKRKEEEHCKKTAAELSGYRKNCADLIGACLDFDIWYSLSRFAEAYRMTYPVFVSGKKSDAASCKDLDLASGHDRHISETVFRMESGRNISLVRKLGFEKTVPVSYDVSGAVLLSGVNSGGKTSLLDLCGQCVILAHMGLPVPAASCEITPVEEFYYFGKSKGTLDAGAFETTLRNFSVVSGNKDKIIFADELESITEPGASARIIAGLIETLSKNGRILSVFVSHLSEAIAENCDVPVRIDGIDATGLDENLNLIVERNPVRNHIAKSTPELIIEKLVRSTDGCEQAFYESLKRKFT